MANWKGSTRKQRLPGNWRSIRRRVLERDGFRCTWVQGGQRCPEPATDVDHIRPEGGDDEENLQSLCNPHHLIKTGRDSHAQRHKAIAKAKARNERRFGHAEEHTGTGKPFVHPWMR